MDLGSFALCLFCVELKQVLCFVSLPFRVYTALPQDGKGWVRMDEWLQRMRKGSVQESGDDGGDDGSEVR